MVATSISILIMRHSEPPGMQFLWRSIWHGKVPRKYSFFIRTVALGRIQTIANLIKWNIVVVAWSCMCKCSFESIDLSLHPIVAKDLWSFLYTVCEVKLLTPQKVVAVHFCCLRMFGWHRNSLIWNAASLCLMWTVWREK